jgi:hypothetical protein
MDTDIISRILYHRLYTQPSTSYRNYFRKKVKGIANVDKISYILCKYHKNENNHTNVDRIEFRV